MVRLHFQTLACGNGSAYPTERPLASKSYFFFAVPIKTIKTIGTNTMM